MFGCFIVGGRKKKRDYFILKGSSKDKKFMLAKFPELCVKPLASSVHKTLHLAEPRGWDAAAHKSALCLVPPA